MFPIQVEFTVCEVKRTGLQTASSVRMLGKNYSLKRLLGYVATLKDNFGFIETANHDKEIFFHYRQVTVPALQRSLEAMLVWSIQWIVILLEVLVTASNSV